MQTTEKKVTTKRHIILNKNDFLNLMKKGKAESENTIVKIPDNDFLAVMAALHDK